MIKKASIILFALLCLAAAPVWAEENTTVEVFIDSNALNSTVTLVSDGSIVSGPGNKVLSNLPAGSTFEVVTDAAEGSTVLADSIKVQYNDGTSGDLAPIAEDGDTVTYQLPDNAVAVAGAVYFGNLEENTLEEAQAFTESDVQESLGAVTSSEAAAEAEVAAEAETAQSGEADPVTTVDPLSPETGRGQYTIWPLFAALFAAAATALYSTRKNSN